MTTRSPLRLAAALGLAAALVLLALSPSFGRAAPSGNYRPSVPADALRNGCWPLPGGAELDLEYLVRTDDLAITRAGNRRVLVLHVFDAGPVQARHRILRAFADAGVRDRLRLRVDRLPRARPGDLVRARAVLWLPPSAPADLPRCTPATLKRYGTVPVGSD